MTGNNFHQTSLQRNSAAKFFYGIVILLLADCGSHKNSNSPSKKDSDSVKKVSVPTDSDSLKKVVLKKADTVFLKDEISHGDRCIVYIDPDNNPKNYHGLLDFDLVPDQWLNYAAYYSPSKSFDPHKKIISKLPISKQWIGLNQYKGNYYVYAPNDWGADDHIKISDSTIIQYGMEGTMGITIDGVQMLSKKKYQFTLDNANGVTTANKLTLTIIDSANGMTVWKWDNTDGPSYQLMIPAENISKFPLIVNYSGDVKWIEYKFDPIDFTKLLQGK